MEVGWIFRPPSWLGKNRATRQDNVVGSNIGVNICLYVFLGKYVYI
jgi:hypothetical protein